MNIIRIMNNNMHSKKSECERERARAAAIIKTTVIIGNNERMRTRLDSRAQFIAAQKKRRTASTTCWLKQANEFLKKKSEKESNCEMVLSQTL